MPAWASIVYGGRRARAGQAGGGPDRAPGAVGAPADGGGGPGHVKRTASIVGTPAAGSACPSSRVAARAGSPGSVRRRASASTSTPQSWAIGSWRSRALARASAARAVASPKRPVR